MVLGSLIHVLKIIIPIWMGWTARLMSASSRGRQKKNNKSCYSTFVSFRSSVPFSTMASRRVENQLAIPKSCIKKIMKISDAVQLIQNEAVVSVAKVTEEFLAKLITQSYDQAKRLGRKTIKFEDIKAVVEKNSIQLGFLDEVFLRHDHHDQKQQLPQDDVVQDKMGQQEETNDDSKQNISSSTTAVAANTESSGPPPSI